MAQRDYFYDFVKGLLIIFVVLGHSIQLLTDTGGWSDNFLFQIIYTFHMPLFIFISGYFAESSKNKEIKLVIENKFKRLLIPLILYSSVLFIIYMVCYENRGSFLNSAYICYKTYWYLINVFILSVGYRFLCNGRSFAFILLGVLYCVCILFYNHLPKYILIDCQVLRMLPIFTLGVLYKKYGKNIKKKVFNPFSAVLVIFCVLAVRLGCGYDIIFYSPSIRIFDGILCSYLALYLFAHLYNVIKMVKEPCLCIWLGQNSLSIYLFHIVLYKSLYYNNVQIEYSYLNVLILFTSLMCISIVFIRIIKKILPVNYLYIVGI